MIHSLSRTDASIGLNFSISELENYNTIPDPNIRCSVVYNGFLYVIIGEIQGANGIGVFPFGYRIDLSTYTISPLNLSINNNSSSEFIAAGVFGLFDNTLSRAGILHNDGMNDWLLTIIETTNAYSGYSLMKLGLSSGVEGTVVVKKITGISANEDVSNIVRIDNSIVFLTKSKVAGSTFDKIHSLTISSEALTSTDIVTNLLGGHTYISYNNYLNITGGSQWDDTLQQSIPVFRKMYKIDMISPSIVEEVEMTESSSAILPDHLSYAPVIENGNKSYIISNTPDNAAYLLDLDSYATSRIQITDGEIVSNIAFLYNKFIYLLDTNTSTLISFNVSQKTYSVKANNIQFNISNESMDTQAPFFKYNFTHKNASILVSNTTITELIN